MDEGEWLVQQFEDNRPRLRAIAYRMLGSLTDADDALQDAWMRVSRAGTENIENFSGWLTTIVARVCLNMLRSRNTRREAPLDSYVPDPIVCREGELDPEDETLLADSVGLALQVVMDTLSPAERLAFVLHDMFDLPFDEISPMIGRSNQATRQLASRARRRVRDVEIPDSEHDRTQHRAVVDAFFAAGRAGDFDALLALLHPSVVLRADFSPGSPARSTVVHGADAVARRARLGGRTGGQVHPVLVNGSPGVVITLGGRPYSVMAFSVVDNRIVEIDAIGDPQRVGRVAAAVLSGQHRAER